tara:strand:- start:689 stop:973 length:285 start_codon:yes stop_codon:yes gene_type:complete
MTVEEVKFSHEFTLTRLIAQIIKESLGKNFIETGNLIVRALHSQGVVIKVDRECDVCGGRGFMNSIKNGASTACPACYGKASCVAVESLVKEEK